MKNNDLVNLLLMDPNILQAEASGFNTVSITTLEPVKSNDLEIFGAAVHQVFAKGVLGDFWVYEVTPLRRDYTNPKQRVQIALKLDPEHDSDILTYIRRLPNIQGRIKQLLREDMKGEQA